TLLRLERAAPTRSPERQHDREGGAHSRRAFGRNCSLMRFDDLARNRQTETRASVSGGVLIVGLEELVEDAVELLVGNAGAGIPHFHLYAVVDRHHGELNFASVVSELEGIRYQVAEDFIDAIRVPVYGLWKSV